MFNFLLICLIILIECVLLYGIMSYRNRKFMMLFSILNMMLILVFTSNLFFVFSYKINIGALYFCFMVLAQFIILSKWRVFNGRRNIDIVICFVIGFLMLSQPLLFFEGPYISEATFLFMKHILETHGQLVVAIVFTTYFSLHAMSFIYEKCKNLSMYSNYIICAILVQIISSILFYPIVFSVSIFDLNILLLLLTNLIFKILVNLSCLPLIYLLLRNGHLYELGRIKIHKPVIESNSKI